MDLIDAIAKDLGFKYRFELVPDGQYGSLNKDTKQWNGLIRELREKVSILRSLVPLYIKHLHIKVHSISNPLWYPTRVVDL